MCGLAMCCSAFRSHPGSSTNSNHLLARGSTTANMAGWTKPAAERHAVLTPRVDPGTAAKMGWKDDKLQAIKFATTLRAMRQSLAHILFDDHELGVIASTEMDGLEIEDLFWYLNSHRGIATDLFHSIGRVRGDLDAICHRIHKHLAPDGTR